MNKFFFSLCVLFYAYGGQAGFNLQLTCGDYLGAVDFSLQEDQSLPSIQTILLPVFLHKENETTETLYKKVVQEASKSESTFESCVNFFLKAGAYQYAFNFMRDCHSSSTFVVYAKSCDLFQVLIKDLEFRKGQPAMRHLYKEVVSYCEANLSPAEYAFRKAREMYNQGKFAEVIEELNQLSQQTYGSAYYVKLLYVLMNCYSGLKDAGLCLHLANRILSYNNLLPEIASRTHFLRLKYHGHTADSFDDCLAAALANAHNYNDYANIYTFIKERSLWEKLLRCIEEMINVKRNPETTQKMEGCRLFNLYTSYCAVLMRLIHLPNGVITVDDLNEIQRRYMRKFNLAKDQAVSAEDHDLLLRMHESYVGITLPLDLE